MHIQYVRRYLGISLLLLTSCVGYDITSTESSDEIETGDDTLYTDQYVLDLGNRKMDIVFVIDNSQSMSDQQAILADSFEDFIGAFVDRQIDYHIGVISTDNRLANASVWSSGWGSRFLSAGPSSLLWAKSNIPEGQSAPVNKFLDRSMGAQAVVDAFKNNARLGADGSSEEAALLSLTRFFNSDHQGWNAGFLRSDSLLSAVIISDEDESRNSCTVDPNLPNSACDQTTRPSGQAYVYADADAKAHRINAFKSAFSAQRPDRPSLLRLDAVIVKPTNDGSRYDQSCVASGERDGQQGKSYSEVVTELGGTLSSICGNFAPDLERLGEEISSSIEKQFPIKKSDVDASTISVKVNGSELAQAHYSYDSITNRIVLSDDYVASLDLLSGNITIRISYKRQMIGVD